METVEHMDEESRDLVDDKVTLWFFKIDLFM
jgi:hypothetical protein